MLTSIKSFLSAVVQFLSCLGFFLKEGKEIAIGENLKRWCLLWERKQHQAVAGSTFSCEVPPSKLGLLPDLFLSSLLRKFCLCALIHREITLYLAWIDEKEHQLLPLLSLSQTKGKGRVEEGKICLVEDKKPEKGTWGGNRVSKSDSDSHNCCCVTDHISLILPVCALWGGKRNFVIFLPCFCRNGASIREAACSQRLSFHSKAGFVLCL